MAVVYATWGDLSSGPRVRVQGCDPPYRELNSFQKTVPMCYGDHYLCEDHGTTDERMCSVAFFVALNNIPDERHNGSAILAPSLRVQSMMAWKAWW